VMKKGQVQYHGYDEDCESKPQKLDVSSPASGVHGDVVCVPIYPPGLNVSQNPMHTTISCGKDRKCLVSLRQAAPSGAERSAMAWLKLLCRDPGPKASPKPWGARHSELSMIF
jgi:hypothetical protein